MTNASAAQSAQTAYLAAAIRDSNRAMVGDSNDNEIDALRDALRAAVEILPPEVRDALPDVGDTSEWDGD